MKRIMGVMTVIGGVLAGVTAAFAVEVTWSGDIKEVFEVRCRWCHGGERAPEHYEFKKDKDNFVSMGQGPRMDTYSHLVFYTAWPDTGSLMRHLDDGKNTSDGTPGNMYRRLGITEQERQKNLVLFKEWVGNWVLKRWPDVTKEELNGIKVPY